MIVNVDGQLFEEMVNLIKACTIELANSRAREARLQTELEANRLMNEADAQAYLKRDSGTLLYYRRLGLSYYKKGNDVWYTKADIDNWLASGYVNRQSR